MTLVSATQQLLMNTDVPSGIPMDDFVDDVQDYAMEMLLGEIADKLSGDDAIILDDMIDADATVAQIDTWLSARIDNYDTCVLKAIEETRKYIRGEDIA